MSSIILYGGTKTNVMIDVGRFSSVSDLIDKFSY